MAELGLLQSVWTVIEMAQALCNAARKYINAPQVIKDIGERAETVEATLRSIKNALEEIERILKPKLEPDKYNELQQPIVMSVKSCKKALEEKFDLSNRQGKVRTEKTIIARLQVAANDRRIQKWEERLDSINGRLTLAISTASLILQVEKLDSDESMGSVQNELSKLNIENQELDEQIRNWESEIERLESTPQDDTRGSVTTNADAVDQQNCTAVNHAVKTADPEKTHAPLEQGADGNCRDSDQETPLIIAVSKDDSKLVEDLLNQGASLSTKCEDQWSLIHLAIRNETTGTTQCLLERDSRLVDVRDAKSKTPLHHCAEGWGIPHPLQQVKVLLEHGADVNLSARNDQEGNPRTPLYLAVSRSYTEEQNNLVELLVKFLKKANVNIDPRCLPDSWKDYKCLDPHGST